MSNNTPSLLTILAEQIKSSCYGCLPPAWEIWMLAPNNEQALTTLLKTELGIRGPPVPDLISAPFKTLKDAINGYSPGLVPPSPGLVVFVCQRESHERNAANIRRVVEKMPKNKAYCPSLLILAWMTDGDRRERGTIAHEISRRMALKPQLLSQFQQTAIIPMEGRKGINVLFNELRGRMAETLRGWAFDAAPVVRSLMLADYVDALISMASASIESSAVTASGAMPIVLVFAEFLESLNALGTVLQDFILFSPSEKLCMPTFSSDNVRSHEEAFRMVLDYLLRPDFSLCRRIASARQAIQGALQSQPQKELDFPFFPVIHALALDFRDAICASHTLRDELIGQDHRATAVEAYKVVLAAKKLKLDAAISKVSTGTKRGSAEDEVGVADVGVPGQPSTSQAKKKKKNKQPAALAQGSSNQTPAFVQAPPVPPLTSPSLSRLHRAIEMSNRVMTGPRTFG